MGKNALKGIVAQHADTVAKVPPTQPEFWHALFGWAQHSREIVLLDPCANIERIKHNVLSAADKHVRESVGRIFGALTAMRHGGIRQAFASLPLTHRPDRIPGLWNILNGNIALPLELTHYCLAWRQGGKAKVFLTERLNTLHTTTLSPVEIRKLYEAFASVDTVQEAFVRMGNKMEPVAGKPRTLAQLGRVRNAELRRVLVSVYGVKETGSPLQRDDYGALYEVDDNTHAVHVTCPSTGREYWLGVPATCETARAAVLWSFNLDTHSHVDALTLLQEA